VIIAEVHDDEANKNEDISVSQCSHEHHSLCGDTASMELAIAHAQSFVD